LTSSTLTYDNHREVDDQIDKAISLLLSACRDENQFFIKNVVTRICEELGVTDFKDCGFNTINNVKPEMYSLYVADEESDFNWRNLVLNDWGIITETLLWFNANLKIC
jgi:hypothetical protein